MIGNRTRLTSPPTTPHRFAGGACCFCITESQATLTAAAMPPDSAAVRRVFRSGLGALALLVSLLCFSHGSRAQSPLNTGSTGDAEQERSHWSLDSTSTFVAYRVASPLAPVRIERRRFVERLGMQYVRLVGDLESPLRVSARVSLRLDQELGEDCLNDVDRCLSIGSSGARRDFQPLADVTRLEVPEFAIAMARDRWQLDVGRQLAFDDIGFVRFDGGRGQYRTRFATLDVFGGRQALHTLGASYGFELPGSISAQLPNDLDATDAPFVAAPRSVWLLGGSAELGDLKWARARLGFRETQDENGLVARRLAVSLRSQPHPTLGLRAGAVVDPTDGTVVDASASVNYRVALKREGRTADVRVRFRHREPRFDLGSIWAFFDLVPVRQLDLVTHYRLGALTLDAGVRARQSAPEPNETPERDVGVSGSASLKHAGWQATLSGWMWAGDLSPASAVSADIRRRIGMRGFVFARASVWYFDDPFRSQVYAPSLTTAFGAQIRITELSRVVAELEYSRNRVVGDRFRALVSLQLRAWR